ncbi:hypothetical protein GW17_00032771 [Ensete ventricosum]|nr:hypothetical protein GW17_00032771 [Ensete ventricosum]
MHHRRNHLTGDADLSGEDMEMVMASSRDHGVDHLKEDMEYDEFSTLFEEKEPSPEEVEGSLSSPSCFPVLGFAADPKGFHGNERDLEVSDSPVSRVFLSSLGFDRY